MGPNKRQSKPEPPSDGRSLVELIKQAGIVVGAIAAITTAVYGLVRFFSNDAPAGVVTVSGTPRADFPALRDALDQATPPERLEEVLGQYTKAELDAPVLRVQFDATFERLDGETLPLSWRVSRMPDLKTVRREDGQAVEVDTDPDECGCWVFFFKRPPPGPYRASVRIYRDADTRAAGSNPLKTLYADFDVP